MCTRYWNTIYPEDSCTKGDSKRHCVTLVGGVFIMGQWEDVEFEALRQLRLEILSESRGVIDPLLLIDCGFITGVRAELVQGNSIDLTVRNVYQIDGGVTILKNGHRVIPPYRKIEPEFAIQGAHRVFKFLPQHLYQVEFDQTIQMPRNVMGLTFPRSTMSKSGANCETGLFDSGYQGGIGMTVGVKFESYFEEGAAIAQIAFFRADSNKLYDGYYTNDQWRKLAK